MHNYITFDCISSGLGISYDKIEQDLHSTIYPTNVQVQHVQINNRKYYNNLIYLESDVLTNMVVKLWKQIEDAVFSDTNISTNKLQEIQKEILIILCSFEECLSINKQNNNLIVVKGILQKCFTTLNRCLFCLNEMDENSIRKIVIFKSNEYSPSYILLHTYLEVQWILLKLQFLIESKDFIVYFVSVLKSLVQISSHNYKISHNKPDNFGCFCVKKLSLKLQLLAENCDINFWDVLSPILVEDELVSLWLILNFASIQGLNSNFELEGPVSPRIKPNFILIESLLKSFLTKSINNEDFFNFLKYLDKLINYWWRNHSKIDLYQIMWDYFYKNINNWSINKDDFKTVENFLTSIDLITSEEGNSVKNCFNYFLHMLVKHLKKNPNHWTKLKGRIYSRLPINKINEFNEIGLFHIIKLFFSLYECVNFEEITSKLLLILENVSNEIKNSYLVWNSYVVLLILNDRKKISSENIFEPLVCLVDRTISNRNLYHLIKLYVDGLGFIFKKNSEFLSDKTVLFGNWIFKYMIHCQQGELQYLLNFLCEVVRKIHENDDWPRWNNVFQFNILPGLKQIAITAEAPLQVGELAALICHQNRILSKDYVQQFTEEIISPGVILEFLNYYLSDNNDEQILPKEQEIILIQAWVRCSLTLNLTTNLTVKILNLKTISSCVNISVNCNSLHSFIKILSKNVSPTSTNSCLKDLCEICFGNADRWVEKCLESPSSDNLVLHIYSTMGILFFNCSTLLYHKTKSNCVLSRLINVLLLPVEFLKGKSPNNFVLDAIQKTLHYYIQGIFKLNCKNDLYLQRLLKDLIVRYLPYLPVNSSPILKCLENEELCCLIFEKICTAFLSPTCKSVENNTSKALKIIMNSIQNPTVKHVDVIIQKTFPSVLEVLMFHSHKTVALELLKLMISFKNYSGLDDFVKKSLIAVVEKNMAFNDNNTFQLLSILAKLIPQDIKAILPDVKKQVSVIEARRSVGFDNNLRKNLENLEHLLNNCKNL